MFGEVGSCRGAPPPAGLGLPFSLLPCVSALLFQGFALTAATCAARAEEFDPRQIDPCSAGRQCDPIRCDHRTWKQAHRGTRYLASMDQVGRSLAGKKRTETGTALTSDAMRWKPPLPCICAMQCMHASSSASIAPMRKLSVVHQQPCLKHGECPTGPAGLRFMERRPGVGASHGNFVPASSQRWRSATSRRGWLARLTDRQANSEYFVLVLRPLQQLSTCQCRIVSLGGQGQRFKPPIQKIKSRRR
jgi:hypothetical protein